MKTRTHGGRLARVTTLALLAATVGLAGCDFDELLNVEDRDTVNPETLEDPAVIEVVINGAMGDFTNAYNSNDAYVNVSALMADEYFSSGTFTTRTATDRREQFTAANGNTSDAAYVDFHQARRSLKDASARVAELRSTSDADYLNLKALEGFSLLHIAEGWCSGIPLSYVDENDAFVYGTPLSGRELLDTAVAKFDAASPGSYHLAAVGKGRALLDQGDYGAAAAAVVGVPTDFTYFVHHSQSGTQNAIYGQQANGRYSQSNLEGGTGVAFREPEDPRTPWWEDEEGGFDPTIPLYISEKANDYDNPVVLASGVEARLIEAEADLNAPDYGAMTTKLNALRADVAAIMADWVPGYEALVPGASLADLPVPGSAAEARSLLFAERAKWLYLTGHRLGDLRRLVYQYGLPENQAFPSGNYHKGGTYGTDVTFEVDFDEANNPNYEVEMCDVSQAGID